MHLRSLNVVRLISHMISVFFGAIVTYLLSLVPLSLIFGSLKFTLLWVELDMPTEFSLPSLYGPNKIVPWFQLLMSDIFTTMVWLLQHYVWIIAALIVLLTIKKIIMVARYMV